MVSCTIGEKMMPGRTGNYLPADEAHIRKDNQWPGSVRGWKYPSPY